jgi:hypothetical protein
VQARPRRLPSAAAPCTALFAAAVSWLAVISRLPPHCGLRLLSRVRLASRTGPQALNPESLCDFEQGLLACTDTLGTTAIVYQSSRGGQEESNNSRRRRLRRLACSRGADALSSASSANSEARARHETTATTAAGRRRDGSGRPGAAGLDFLRDRRQDAYDTRVPPNAAGPEPRVGHHRDGHYQRKNAAGDADDTLRERPGSCTHQSSLCIRMAFAWAAGAVMRRARTSRACKYAAAARSSVARSMVARRGRMASLPGSEPRLGARSHRPGAGQLAGPLRRVRRYEKTRELSRSAQLGWIAACEAQHCVHIPRAVVLFVVLATALLHVAATPSVRPHSSTAVVQSSPRAAHSSARAAHRWRDESRLRSAH